MQDIFTDIYKENKWNGGSGPGSTTEFCKPLLKFMREYVAHNQISSICDLGCGDLQWMPELLKGAEIQYTGIDCVAHLIESHKKRYTAAYYNFMCRDISEMNCVEIPQADLYVMKDVLQHWPSDTIAGFLRRFFQCKPTAHFIAINCNQQKSFERKLDAQYNFAPLHGKYYPLRLFQPTELFSWNEKTLYRLNPPSDR